MDGGQRKGNFECVCLEHLRRLHRASGALAGNGFSLDLNLSDRGKKIYDHHEI